MTKQTAKNKLVREGRKETRNEILGIIEKAVKGEGAAGVPAEIWAVQALARVKEVLDGQAIKEDAEDLLELGFTSAPGQPVTGTPMEIPRTRNGGVEEVDFKTVMGTLAEASPAPHRKLQVGNILDGYKDLLNSTDNLRLITPDISPYAEIIVQMDNEGNLAISFTHGELVVVPAASNLIRVNGRRALG